MTQTKPRKPRRKRPTFLGLELAPYPPGRRSSSRSPRPTREVSEQDKRSRGIALLMVLFMLVLGTSITLDLQHDSRIQLQLAANSRNALQAEYLARSGMQFTHLLLAFNSQFLRMKTQFKKFLKMAPPEVQMLMNRLQLWKIIPINCNMLKQLFGGAFGRAKRKPPEGDQGKLYAFGDFKGGCSATLEDESAKINLNRFANYQDAIKLRAMLANLFAPRRYDPLFERTQANGDAINRQEQIAAFEDWVDSNQQVAGEGGSSEDGKYKYSERGYRTKNSYFDSLDEIRLVYGVDDLFYQTFAQYFTVYGPTFRVNINSAAKESMSALIMTYAKLKPQERTIFFTPQYAKFLDAMMSYRSYLGFNSRDEFVNWVKQPVLLDPNMFPGAGGGAGQGAQNQTFANELPKFQLDTTKMGSTIITNADTFRINTSGQVGTIERRITAVIHVQPRGKRDVYFWRLH
ncbi:MAG: hypothetical protein EP343_07635 [Deltaproteobacteria bacterium]|nr:MAG: hypothetical protein EP343_07635 [Deltaproteobacteria bacterium]